MFGSPVARVVERGGAIQCAHCGQELSAASQAIAVRGDHRHRLENPGGYRFEVACFAAAPGVTAAGASSDEGTWFDGYTWQRSYCNGCKRHVGWRFRSPRHVFDALIREHSEPASPARAG